MFEFFKKKRRRHSGNSLKFPVNTPEPLQPKPLSQLFLFSTISFVLSALLLQFLITLQTSLFLQSYSIRFTYQLFGISFSFVSGAKWPVERIFLVYGMGMVFVFLVGLALVLLLKKVKFSNWKLKLSITWMAFLMVHTLPLGIVAGIFIFDGFGIAYFWLFDSMLVRGIIALLIVPLMFFYRSFWISLFLKTAYSASLLSEGKNRRIFIKTVFIQPWLAGVPILLFFVLPHFAWSWLVFIVGLGLVLLPVFDDKISKRKYLVNKYSERIFRVSYPAQLFLVLLLILWLADYFSKTNF